MVHDADKICGNEYNELHGYWTCNLLYHIVSVDYDDKLWHGKIPNYIDHTLFGILYTCSRMELAQYISYSGTILQFI